MFFRIMFFRILALLPILALAQLSGDTDVTISTSTSREQNDAKLLAAVNKVYEQSHANDLNPVPMLAAAIANGCGLLATASVGEYNALSDGTVVKVTQPKADLALNHASITKTLWALLLQIAVNDEGKDFAWEDKITKFIPSASNTAFKDATVLGVASHTACLHGDFLPTEEQYRTMSTKYADDPLGTKQAVEHGWFHARIDAELENGLRPDCVIDPENPPDILYAHDGGAFILMYIATTLFQQNFIELAQTKIFDTLEMTTASVSSGMGGPSGGLYASVQDMARYGRFHLSGYLGELELNDKDNLPFSKAAKDLLRKEDFAR